MHQPAEQIVRVPLDREANWMIWNGPDGEVVGLVNEAMPDGDEVVRVDLHAAFVNRGNAGTD
jgi:hypothetical protein